MSSLLKRPSILSHLRKHICLLHYTHVFHYYFSWSEICNGREDIYYSVFTLACSRLRVHACVFTLAYPPLHVRPYMSTLVCSPLCVHPCVFTPTAFPGLAQRHAIALSLSSYPFPISQQSYKWLSYSVTGMKCARSNRCARNNKWLPYRFLGF